MKITEKALQENSSNGAERLVVIAVIVRSFAKFRTNLKKQGVLALTFSNPQDYDLIQQGDVFSFMNLDDFSPGVPLIVSIQHKDGTINTVECNHTYNALQIHWFKAGSALNYIKKLEG